MGTTNVFNIKTGMKGTLHANIVKNSNDIVNFLAFVPEYVYDHMPSLELCSGEDELLKALGSLNSQDYSDVMCLNKHVLDILNVKCTPIWSSQNRDLEERVVNNAVKFMKFNLASYNKILGKETLTVKDVTDVDDTIYLKQLNDSFFKNESVVRDTVLSLPRQHVLSNTLQETLNSLLPEGPGSDDITNTYYLRLIRFDCKNGQTVAGAIVVCKPGFAKYVLSSIVDENKKLLFNLIIKELADNFGYNNMYRSPLYYFFLQYYGRPVIDNKTKYDIGDKM